MSAPAGWYIDPSDPSREMYWNGGGWLRSQTRTTTDSARPLPTAAPLPAAAQVTPDDIDDQYQAAMLFHAAAQTAALQRIRGYLAFLAWVVAIGIILGLIGAIASVVTAVG